MISFISAIDMCFFKFTPFEGKGSADLEQGNSFNTNQNIFEAWLQEDPFKKVCQGGSSPISSLLIATFHLFGVIFSIPLTTKSLKRIHL